MIGEGDRFELLAVCTNAGGIGKPARLGPVRVGRDGLDGDAQSNQAHHGGPDQAICVYADEDYAAFAEADLAPRLVSGAFGENFATRGIDWRAAAIGQRFTGERGGLVFEVSCFRVPCRNLQVCSEHFPHALVETRRTGGYARVIATGTAEAGEVFVAGPAPEPALTLERHVEIVTRELRNPDEAQRLAAIEEALKQPALGGRARELLEKAQARAGA